MSWDVLPGNDGNDNGWSCHGAADDEPQQDDAMGTSARDAIEWAMKLRAQGKWRTRRDELLAQEVSDDT